MNFAFFGTSDYCIPILDALHNNFDLRLVITRPDKPIGRKKILTPSATKLWAEQHNISVITPSTLKKDSPDRALTMKQIDNVTMDLAVVSDYGLIIPETLFNKPRLGTLNVHFSKLPDLRGPSPVQYTLLRGDPETWITIFKLESPQELEIKMDSGPILFQKSYPVKDEDTTATLYTRLFKEAAHVLPQIIENYSENRVAPRPQNHNLATYCRFLTKDDGYIDWNPLQKAIKGEEISIEELPKIQQEAMKTLNTKYKIINTKYIHNFYQSMTPWPGMWTIGPDGKRIIIRKCHLENGQLILDEIQIEGKNSIKIPNG